MNPATSETRSDVAASPASADPSSSRSRAGLKRGIAAPLAALRASMETLSVDLEGEDPRVTILDGAVDQIVRLGRSLQALVDYAVPPELNPLPCTLEELARSAHAQLVGSGYRTLQLAQENGTARAVVDGPLFTRCLTYLVSAHVAESDEAMLHATVEGPWLVLSLLVRPEGAVIPMSHAVQGSSRSEEEGLSILLAARELERMGGSLEVTEPAAATRVVVRLPRETEVGR